MVNSGREGWCAASRGLLMERDTDKKRQTGDAGAKNAKMARREAARGCVKVGRTRLASGDFVAASAPEQAGGRESVDRMVCLSVQTMNGPDAFSV